MSWNRENVVWQSVDGTWNRGFYAVSWVDPSPDADPEWDVEYDYDQFAWLRTGLRTAGEAQLCWDGANPGGWHEVATPALVHELEEIKERFLGAERRRA